MNGPIMDKITAGVATGAVVSPWWLPAIKAVSDGASIALPILGVLWLLIQMVAWFRKGRK